MSKNGWRDACFVMVAMNLFLLYTMHEAKYRWLEQLNAKPKIIHTCQEENGPAESN